MTDLTARVRETIQKYDMIREGDLVLAGVSGGPDSLALLYILRDLAAELKFTLHAAHLDHCFRSRQAEEEAFWVKETAQSWGIGCTIEKINVPQIAKERKLSAQDAGHLARKEFFVRLASQLGAGRIALGHHADDQAETVLMHFLTGAGLEGLRGMLPVNGLIIRPLLFTGREEIEEFCRSRGLEPRRDPSNLKNIYLRNKIRNVVLPYLKKEINPNLAHALNQTARILGADEDCLNDLADKRKAEIASYTWHETGREIALDLEKYRALPVSIQRRLIRKVYRDLLIGRSLSFFQVEEIRELALYGQTGKHLPLPGGGTVEKSYSALAFYADRRPAAQPLPVRKLFIPGTTELPELGKSITTAICSPGNAARIRQTIGPAGNELLLPWPEENRVLEVRSRREGDSINLQTGGGRKKLKEYFIDSKIPRRERDTILLIADGKEILWIPGLGVRAKPTDIPDCASYLHLTMKELAGDEGSGEL